MFKRSFASKDRATKATKSKTSKRSFVYSDEVLKQKLLASLDSRPPAVKSMPHPTSPIVTIGVGQAGRLFAAHEDVLMRSPVMAKAVRDLFYSNDSPKRIELLDEDPETFSCVLEYLYKGDYTPRLLHTRSRGWHLEAPEGVSSPHSLKNNGAGGATLFHTQVGGVILRDTALYCAGQRYGIPELQKLALRKQGLQSGIGVDVILRSMRFAYANTPESDSKLRAHFLALVVRARHTFKRSGTMQAEMNRGGAMWFDLFVALANHLDDLASASTTPKTV